MAPQKCGGANGNADPSSQTTLLGMTVIGGGMNYGLPVGVGSVTFNALCIFS